MLVKKEEELKLCEANCGTVLRGQQKRFCSRECQTKVQHPKRGKQIEVKTRPTWTCDKCREVIEVPFDITGSGYKARKFDKFKAEHICQ